jgi:thioesterase domain-containing protein
LPRPEFEPADKSAPPATLTEIILTRIWCEVLGVKHVCVQDNFFESGGHSLLAVQLISKINKSLNLNVPIPVFFQNPTVHGLAAVLDRENHGKREPKLIPLQAGCSRGTLFLLDISIGLCRLAQNLEGAGPAIYGTAVPLNRKTFQAASCDDVDELPSLRELAAAHTALIQSHAPSGPCLLAGHSFGGLLTFEVAHQLQQMGRKVEMIFLLDSWATRPVWWKKFKILTWARVRQSIAFRSTYLWSKARNEILRMFRQPNSASLPGATPVADLNQINHPIGDVPWEIWEKIYRIARKHYKLIPLESRAVLFRAQHNADVSYLYPVHANLGWDGLFKNGLRMVEIPGNHLSLLKDPQAITLAERVKEYLEELSDSGQACGNSLPRKADKSVPSPH